MPSDQSEESEAPRWARLESYCRVCGRRLLLLTSKRSGRCSGCRGANLYEVDA